MPRGAPVAKLWSPRRNGLFSNVIDGEGAGAVTEFLACTALIAEEGAGSLSRFCSIGLIYVPERAQGVI
jgi:hypothetical protein